MLPRVLVKSLKMEKWTIEKDLMMNRDRTAGIADSENEIIKRFRYHKLPLNINNVKILYKFNIDVIIGDKGYDTTYIVHAIKYWFKLPLYVPTEFGPAYLKHPAYKVIYLIAPKKYEPYSLESIISNIEVETKEETELKRKVKLKEILKILYRLESFSKEIILKK